MAGPLTGVRVLDLSRVLAGPWCTQIFADMGADVIKVERPGSGDDTRHWGPPWLTDSNGDQTRESAYYLSANRGKRSITIDISRPQGCDLVRQLAAKADVVVENFKTGGLASKGLGYADLAAINPRLIYCSITGFGHTGPMSETPGYDYLIQAQSGLMSITGVADGQPGAGPQRVGVATADLTTGMNAAIAVLGALHHRNESGVGQHIDLALLDVQVSWLANQAQNYFCSGKAPRRTGTNHPNLAPYGPFPTADGSLIIAVGNDAQFKRLCSALGIEQISSDSRFASNADRIENRESLTDMISAQTVTSSSDGLTGLLQRARVPCGRVQSIDEVFCDPQIVAREMIVEVKHPQHGVVKTVANPIKYSATPLDYPRAPPTLGQDTDCILSDVLDLSDAQINDMKSRGTV